MDLLADYLGARHDEDVARLRRVLALRAMVATGMSQREIATALGISHLPERGVVIAGDAFATFDLLRRRPMLGPMPREFDVDPDRSL